MPAVDLAIGGTTRTDIVSREPGVRRGATFVSLARREMDPAGWSRFDKTVVDDWDCNMTVREFRDMIDAGEFSRGRLHADIGEVVAGLKPGRETDDERILVHTTGMVSHDIGIAMRWIYKRRWRKVLGVPLPTAVAQAAIGTEGLRVTIGDRPLPACGGGEQTRSAVSTRRPVATAPSPAIFARALPGREGRRAEPRAPPSAMRRHPARSSR